MIEITLAVQVAIAVVAERDMNKLTVITLASATLIIEFALRPMCKTTLWTVLACLVLCPVPAKLLYGFGTGIQTTRQGEAPQAQQSLGHFEFLPILQSVLCIIIVAFQITEATQGVEVCFDRRRKDSSQPANPRA